MKCRGPNTCGVLSVYPSNYHADCDAFYYHNIITLIMKLIRYDALSRKLHTQESEGTKSSERAENVEVVILMMIVIILMRAPVKEQRM